MCERKGFPLPLPGEERSDAIEKSRPGEGPGFELSRTGSGMVPQAPRVWRCVWIPACAGMTSDLEHFSIRLNLRIPKSGAI